ncbi:MAG: PhoX family protein [Candidatus Thiodiazotropha sp. (ex Notomyrtea botanica)]|nr:PhoX family protein [Candidatus Thiodiazotropha sp. (ex Notomyrtea botanica)]
MHLPLKSLALGLSVALTVTTGVAVAGKDKTVKGPMKFDPIPGSATVLTDDWAQPHIIPEGFRMYKISDETDLNIYIDNPNPSKTIDRDMPDLTDMNSANETGRKKGRFLYRTHEVDNGGAVSVVDLKTGEAKVIAQATDGDEPLMGPTFPEFTQGRDLDGIRWTPWGTLLFAEEDPEGCVYEMFFDRHDPTVVVDVKDRPAVGRIRHEGIEVGPKGEVYVIDELNGGSIFKFVADRRGDLSSGQLYALKLKELTIDEQSYGSGHPHTGAFEWVALDRDQVQIDAKVAADWVDATEFGRPEDVEAIEHMLYVAETSEDRVLAINLEKTLSQHS